MGDCNLTTMIAPVILVFVVQLVIAGPGIGLAFNSQFPDVARVGQQYSFTLSQATFQSDRSKTVLGLQDGPSWLAINSTTNTLHGKPSSSDVGNATFSLLATDPTGATTMLATLLIREGSGPVIKSNITEILSKAGTLTGSTSIVLPPLSTFSIEFASVLPAEHSKLFSSVTMRDHTPVPAWINFDAPTSRISGVTPRVDKDPQRLEMDIIVSELTGFASARISFTVSVSTHQFFFDPVETIANIPAGENVNITTLRSKLMFDGHSIGDADLASATVQKPDWLEFNAQDISLRGTPPAGIGTENITILAFDKYGDATNMVLRLNLGFGKLYKGHIGTLTATAGKEFTYQMVVADFIGDDLDVEVDLGVASKWLKFDNNKLVIRGTVPEYTASQMITANLTIVNKEKGLRDFQDFVLQISSVALSDPKTGDNAPLTSRNKIAKIAGILVGVLLGLLLLLLIVLCCRRRWKPLGAESSVAFRPRLPSILQRKTKPQHIWSTANDDGDTTFMSEMLEGPPKVSLNFSSNYLNKMPSKEVDDARSLRSRISRKLSKRMKRNSRSSMASFETSSVFRFHRTAKTSKPDSEEGQVYQRMMQSPIQRDQQRTPDPDGIDRTQYATSPSVALSVDTDILMEDFEDEPPDLADTEKAPQTPQHAFQLPARNHLYNAHKLARQLGHQSVDMASRSSGPESSTRPVPRRGPQHSSFFAGGSRRRKNAPRLGYMLSTIDGSPEAALDEDGNYLPDERQIPQTSDRNEFVQPGRISRMTTISTSRDWETVGSDRSGSPSPGRSITKKGNQRRWSSLSRDYSRYIAPRRNSRRGDAIYGSQQQRSNTNIWDGEPRDYTYGDISGSSSLYSWSPPRGSSSILDLTHTLDVGMLQSKLEGQVPIMERPRAAFRLSSRSPFAMLSGNEQREPQKDPRKVLKDCAKDNARVVYGERAQQPVSVEGRGFLSLKGRTVRGNEAFI